MLGIGLGKFFESAPTVSRTVFNRMYDTPIVVIIAAVPRTARIGRSASRSIATPRNPLSTIVTTNAKASAPTSANPVRIVPCPSIPSRFSAAIPINEATMNTLKCAKLMSSRMP